MMNKLAPLCLLLLLFTCGCGNNAALDQAAASDLINDYLSAKPVFETEKIALGEIKFKSNSDKRELEKLKDLRNKNFIALELLEQKKKFLSKDSVYVYLVTLTDKSKPYILNQERNQAIVKVMEYDLDESKPARLDKSGNKNATITVMLKKVKNAFTVFYKDKNTGSNFITKTYKLKYQKDQGWIVTGE